MKETQVIIKNQNRITSLEISTSNKPSDKVDHE
jgi:hypothetical protein